MKKSYNSDKILEWKHETKEEAEELTKLKREEEQTEAASTDLQETLNDDGIKIKTEIEIKQEIVYDPNE